MFHVGLQSNASIIENVDAVLRSVKGFLLKHFWICCTLVENLSHNMLLQYYHLGKDKKLSAIFSWYGFLSLSNCPRFKYSMDGVYCLSLKATLCNESCAARQGHLATSLMLLSNNCLIRNMNFQLSDSALAAGLKAGAWSSAWTGPPPPAVRF